MNKRVVMINIIFILVYFSSPILPVHAIDDTQPTLQIVEAEGYVNSSVYVSIQLTDALSLSALSFDIYYDDSSLRINSASIDSSILNNAVINYDNPGFFSFNMAQIDPIQTDGTIVHLWFNILPEAPIGDLPLTLVIGEAYDNQLIAMTIKGVHGNIRVLERTFNYEYIYLYTGYDQTPQTQGKIIQIDYSSYQLNQLAAGNFEFYYDPTKLEYMNYEMGGSYLDPSVLHQMNSSIPGYLNLSFAWHQGANYSYPLMKVRFKVISNVTGSTDVILKPTNLYDADLTPLLCEDIVTSVRLLEVSPSENYPDVTLSSYIGSNKSSFDVILSVEGESKIAAGDFQIIYDATRIQATNISIDPSFSDIGGYLIYNETIDQGLIRFSLIVEEGLSLPTTLMTITFEPTNPNITTSGQISIQGSGIVDQAFQPVLLDYVFGSYELSQAYRIIFQDMDGSIIQELIYFENETIVAPEAPEKLGYRFTGWDQTFDKATSDLVIHAIYEIDHSTQFLSKTVIYNGQPYSLELINLPEGSHVTYSHSISYTLPGIYDVEATISKEGYEDLVLQATLTILKAPLTIKADHQATPYGSNLANLTYTIIGTLYDDIPISLTKDEGTSAGQYVIHVSAEHPYYDITLVDGIYSIVGQDIDVSTLKFDSKTFVYDGSAKEIQVDGVLPLGIKSIEYSNHQATDAGTYFAVAHFVVEDGYNPIDNWVIEWSIEPAAILGITMIDQTFTYDGYSHGLEVNTLDTIYGDRLNVIYSPIQSSINAGSYIITATLSHPNYQTLHLTATLTIEKAIQVIQPDDFVINVNDTYIEIFYKDTPTLVNISIDGIQFINGNRINDLLDYHTYNISLYLSETHNLLPSNIITLEITTYRSYNHLMSIVERNQEFVSMHTYDDLLYLYHEIDHTHPSHHEALWIEYETIIDAYNTYVTKMNHDFDQVTHYTGYIYPILALSIQSILVVFRHKRGRDTL